MINVCHILIFRAKAYVIRALLLCDWSVQQTASKPQTQYRKECCSVVSSRFFGGALRDIPKYGCEGDLTFIFAINIFTFTDNVLQLKVNLEKYIF